MSLTTIRNSIIFGCKGSLVDVIGKKIPTYTRANPLWLEDSIDGKIILSPTESFNPAFRTDEQYIYLEPSSVNEVLFNNALDRPEWMKGSNVSVKGNSVVSPTGAREGDRLLWGAGIGSTQLIKTPVTLIAGDTYCISAYIKANTDNFENNDRISLFAEGVTEIEGDSHPIYLSQLNSKVGRWIKVEGLFTPKGVSLANRRYLPSLENSGNGTYPNFTVSNFTETSLTLFASTTMSIPSNALIGGEYTISKPNVPDISYAIVGNTAFNEVGSSLTITISPDSGNPTLDGVNVNDVGVISNRSKLDAYVGIYVENINSIDVAGIQVEKKKFATSMVFQGAEVRPKSDSVLFYEDSPVKDEENWAMYFELTNWQGEGNVIDLESFKISINNSEQLTFTGLNFSPYLIAELPSFKVLIEVNNIKLEARFYLNGILIQQINLTQEFVGNLDDQFILTSQGIREFKDYVFFRGVLSSASDTEGQLGKNDIELIFKEESIIPLEAIHYGNPILVLPAIAVPPRLREKYAIPVSAVDYSTNQVTTSYSAGQTVIQKVLSGSTTMLSPEAVTIQRPEREERKLLTIGYANALSLALNVDQYVFTLDSAKGIRVGDNLVFRDTILSGKASVRFPNTAIDLQTINNVDVNAKKVTLGTVSSFTLSRALVITDRNQDVGEVIVEEIDEVSRTLKLNNVLDIKVGHIIYQTKYELEISRYNYFVSLMEKVEGVSIDQTFSNGIVFRNDNDYEVLITPRIRIFM